MNNQYPQVPPGWYQAPHANNELRYWDGNQWLDLAPGQMQQNYAQGDYPGPAEKSRLSWWQWALIVIAGLVVLGGIASLLGGGDGEAEPQQTETATTATPTPTETMAKETTEPAPSQVFVPDVVGKTVNEAVKELERVGLKPSADSNGDAVVTKTSPAAGKQVDEDTRVDIEAEEESSLTVSQENAIDSGNSYLDFMAFSRTGLIEQLEYEGYDTEDAEFAVDHIDPDWNKQAAKKAEEYLDWTSFSRQGLIDQLLYEGFTQEQAEYGADAVGY